MIAYDNLKVIIKDFITSKEAVILESKKQQKHKRKLYHYLMWPFNYKSVRVHVV